MTPAAGTVTLVTMDEIAKELARIGKAFERQNEILAERMSMPKGKFAGIAGILEYIVLIASALAILGIVDMVIGWAGGG